MLESPKIEHETGDAGILSLLTTSPIMVEWVCAGGPNLIKFNRFQPFSVKMVVE